MAEKNNNGRSWVEISTDTLLKNYQIYGRLLPNGVKVMAVVKADAYGHGDQVVSRLLYDHGVENFAVSNIDEAIHLREAGVGGQILILGYTPIARAQELVANRLTQALLSEEYAEQLSSTGLPIDCHFAIDTGMRRIGLNADDPDLCERIIRQYYRRLRVNGMFTHLCVADSDNPEQVEFTKKQIAMFEEIAGRVADLSLPYCHCLNSAGGLWHKSDVSCFSRLGIMLYGLKPDYMNTLPNGISPALTWKSVVSMVKEVKTEDTIGYGRTVCVEHPMSIATIPTGYADGYNRLLSNKGYVLIHGSKAPIVGRVCMDQMMVDVTNIANVGMGTEVVLIGNSSDQVLTADDVAKMIDTIGYEVVCSISKCVERVYL